MKPKRPFVRIAIVALASAAAAVHLPGLNRQVKEN